MKVINLSNMISHIYCKNSYLRGPFIQGDGYLLNLKEDGFFYSYDENSNQYFSETHIDGKLHYTLRENLLDEECVLLDEKFNYTEKYGNKRSHLFQWKYLEGRFIKSVSTGGWHSRYSLEAYSDIDEKKVAEIEFNYSDSIYYQDSLIMLSIAPKIVSKINNNLEFKWQREFPHDHMHGSVKQELLDYKDSVITNLGIADRDKKEDGEIIALLKETGETKWSFKHDVPIHSCALIKDRVYLTSFNQWLILDAATGSIVLEGDSGLNVNEDAAIYSSLWSDGEFLYFSSNKGEKIRIFHELTGQFHCDIDEPEGFIISTRPPISLNSYHYFDLGAGSNSIVSNAMGCYHGVLITSTEEIRKGPPFNIEIEENHNFVINTLEQEKGQAYEIAFDEPELGHILRFGRIEAQKIAFANTYNTLASLSDDYGKHINKQFNGQIVFKINEKTLQKPIDDKQLVEKLDLLCTLVNKHCEQYIAPNAKESVNASWQWV